MNAPENPPPYTTVAQTPAPAKGRNFLGCGCGGLILAVVLCVVAGVGILEFMRFDSWNTGLAAYRDGQCLDAIEDLERVVDFDGVGLVERFDSTFDTARAPELIAECEAFQSAVAPAEGDAFGRSTAYLMEFQEDFPNSDLNKIARERIGDWYEDAGLEEFADEDFCQAFQEGMGIEQLEMLEADLPEITFQCGKNYVADGDYENGLVFLARFREEYPDHELIPDVEQVLAEAEVAYAEALGAPEISQPSAVGTAPEGRVLWSVQNDSPNRIQIILTGEETLIEEIEVCDDCVEYELAPKSCPEIGPVRDIELPPGDYQVVVKAIGDDSVTPYRGSFAFEGGTAYDECFYISSGEGYNAADDPVVASPEEFPTTILQTVSTYDLEPGMCYEYPAEYVGDVDVYDCAEPHLYEIFAVFDLEDPLDAPYPGDEEVYTLADEACATYFEPYVGIDYDLSLLYYFPFYPDESSWATGDREIACVLYQPDDSGNEDLRLLGSMQGAER
jgi:hypothetical protein